MSDYTTVYTFKLSIEGQKALEDAKALREQIAKALSEGVGGQEFASLTKALDELRRTAVEIAQPFKEYTLAVKEASAQSGGLARDLKALDTALDSVAGKAQRAAQAVKGMRGDGGTSPIMPLQDDDLSDLRELYQRVEEQRRAQREHMSIKADELRLEKEQTQAVYERGQMISSLNRQNDAHLRGMFERLSAQENLSDPNIRNALRRAYQQNNQPIPFELQNPMEKFNEGIRESTREMWAARRSAYDLQSMGTSLTRTGLAWAAGMALVSREYLQFSEVATRAEMAMRLNVELQDDFRDALLESSAAIGVFDPAELAEGMRLWAAGTGEVVQSQEQLNRLMGDTLNIQKLAAMNNVDLTTTTEQVAGVMFEYGMNVSDVAHITEIMNYVAAASFANVNDLGSAFRMVGPVAASMGITFEQTATALSLLSDNNIKGTMAGRGFRQMLIQMLKPSAEYNEVMNKMLGTTEGVKNAWQEIVFPGGEFMGLPEYIDLLAESTENLTDKQKNERLAALATANALPGLLTLVNKQIEARKYGVNIMSAYEKVMLGVTDAETLAYKRFYEETTGLPFTIEGATALMTTMWDKYEKSDSVRMMRIQRTWQKIFVDLGEIITKNVTPDLEKLTKIVTALADFLNDHPGWESFLKWMTAVNVAGGIVLNTLGKMGYAFTAVKIIAGGLQSLLAGTALGGLLGSGGAAVSATAGATSGGILLPAGVSSAPAAAGGIQGLIASLGGVTTIASALAPIASIVALGFLGAQQNRPRAEEQREMVARLSEANQATVEAMFDFRPALGGYQARNEEAMALVTRALGEDVVNTRALSSVSGSFILSVEEMAKVLQTIRAEFLGNIVNTSAWVDPHTWARRTSDTGITPMRGAMEESDIDMAPIVAYYEYSQQRLKIEEDFHAKRQQLTRNYHEWERSAYQNLLDNLGQLQASFDKDGLRRQEDYDERLFKMARDFEKSEEKAQKQHQDNLRKQQLAHRDRMIDLLEARDVRGIVKEMRRYKQEQEEAGKSLAEQRQEREQDYAQRIREEEERFAKESRRREEDYEERREQMREAFEKERAERNRQLGIALAESREQEQKQLQQLADDFYKNLVGIENLLSTHLEQIMEDLQTFRDDYVGMWRDISEGAMRAFQEAWHMDSIIDPGTGSDYSAAGVAATSGGYGYIPPNTTADDILRRRNMGYRASGGYAGYGHYLLGEGGKEFVLNARTTRMMEDRYGYLSQGTFQQSSSSITFAPTFNGMGRQDRSWFMAAAAKLFDQKMYQLQREVR